MANEGLGIGIPDPKNASCHPGGDSYWGDNPIDLYFVDPKKKPLESNIDHQEFHEMCMNIFLLKGPQAFKND